MDGKEKQCVTVYSRSMKGKEDKVTVPFDDYTSAIRFAHTFKPKKGYEVMKVTIEKHWWLF